MRLYLEILAVLVALGWIGFLVIHPVDIPVYMPSQEVEPHPAESIVGVRGQTFTAPTSGLRRIDLKVDTHIPQGEWVRVEFELARGVAPRKTLASAIAVFDRTRDSWPVRLTFDSNLTTAGDRLYLRLESILSSPRAAIFYHYSRQNIDPQGAFFDLDEPLETEQDLLMSVFRAQQMPKPLAWAEAFIARANRAAQRSDLVPAGLVNLVAALALAATVVAVTAVTHQVVRTWKGETTPITKPALAAVLSATSLLCLAWGEIPIGTLLLELT